MKGDLSQPTLGLLRRILEEMQPEEIYSQDENKKFWRDALFDAAFAPAIIDVAASYNFRWSEIIPDLFTGKFGEQNSHFSNALPSYFCEQTLRKLLVFALRSSRNTPLGDELHQALVSDGFDLGAEVLPKSEQKDHPLSLAEREITKKVVQRFLHEGEATSERFLYKELKDSRASLAESIRRLVDRAVLKVADQSNETYLPKAIAFHYCGDPDALATAKKSTEMVLRVIHSFAEGDLDTEDTDQRSYTPENVLGAARTIDPKVDAHMVRVGLALAEEFGVFLALQRNPEQTAVAIFRPGRRIFEMGDNPWDEHIRRCSVSVERAWEKKQNTSSVAPTIPAYDIVEGYDGIMDNRKVFLVHGHAEESRDTIATFLRSLDLEAVILHEQANQGRTIIEKLEKHADVGFAVVLLTPDDVGASAALPERTQRRARQNVILELGYFIGKLGRERVCAVYVEGVELPSDYHGVLYVPFDQNGTWRSKLAKELSAAGIEVNLKEPAVMALTKRKITA
jgi:hypothetical protein